DVPLTTPLSVPTIGSPPHAAVNQTYGAAPRSAAASAAVIRSSTADCFDGGGRISRSAIVGACVTIETVTGAVRLSGRTSTSARSPAAALLATSSVTSHQPMFCSLPLPSPLMPAMVTPAAGVISADSTAMGLGTATLMTVL